MSIFGFLKSMTRITPKAWLGYDQLKEETKGLFVVLKNLFIADKPVREESFEEAMRRLKLSEADIDERIHRYHFYALFFAIAGLIAFLYAFFLLFHYVTIIGWILGLAVSALFFSQAFKFSFWALQMKRRTLGLTFNDWKRVVLGIKD